MVQVVWKKVVFVRPKGEASAIPDNAIYTDGEAIPDPSGGYLKYGASI